MTPTPRWLRPTDTNEARELMLNAEKYGNFDRAALAALTLADRTALTNAAESAAYERQAQVYATLHLADATWHIGHDS